MTRRSRSRWDRYPPLTGALIAVLLAVFVLPSSLNVPQSNPTQTIEFAPVPPEDEQPPPPETGDVNALGLGSSSTAPSGDAPGGDGRGGAELPPVPVPEGVGERPVTKRCVMTPTGPRQTEDPMSPPCVAHFEGDNGGATYRGVTREEVRVVIYLDPSTTSGTESDSAESSQRGCVDLGKEPGGSETITPKYMRVFQQYFNFRYQTYGRSAHFWVCFASSNDDGTRTPEHRRADAADHLANVDPFAVIMSQIRNGLEDAYVDPMASAGVLVFGSASGSRPAEYFRRFPGLVWSYLPSVEEQARLYATYVCTKVLGHPVVDSGNDAWNGGSRTFGWLQTTDQTKPNLLRFAEVAREPIEGCGVVFADEATFPNAGQINQARGGDPAANYARANMASFQRNGVTTILWPGGYETDHGKAAQTLGYAPEIIVAGDGLLDGTVGGSYQNQGFWSHAWTATQQVRVVGGGEDPCRRALRETYPEAGEGDMTRICSFPYYRDLRQLFTGIQVAGPNLTVGSVDQGFHAIPGVPSDDPQVAACFYNPGDYTCVKDGTSEFWDPQGTATGGCWRMVEGGRRYLADEWDRGNIDARAGADDPCNEYSSTPLLY
ncbi:MAG TPA: hypothetical protein VGA69_04585 [Nitriliruptorales bacterium]